MLSCFALAVGTVAGDGMVWTPDTLCRHRAELWAASSSVSNGQRLESNWKKWDNRPVIYSCEGVKRQRDKGDLPATCILTSGMGCNFSPDEPNIIPLTTSLRPWREEWHHWSSGSPGELDQRGGKWKRKAESRPEWAARAGRERRWSERCVEVPSVPKTRCSEQ